MSDQNTANRRRPPALLWALLAALAAGIGFIVGLLRRRKKSGSREPIVARFPDIGVTITVPPQPRSALIVERYMPPIGELHSDQDEFTPNRPLLNFEIVDADYPDLTISTFEPPFELEMAYTEEQVRNARNEADTFKKYVPGESAQPMPVFGFWNGLRWVLFKAGKHQLTYTPNEPPGTGGRVTVKITNWADPAIGAWPM